MFSVDPVTNAITLATQPGFVHPRFGDATVTGRAGSKVEPCDKRITLVIRISVAAGNFADRTDILRPAAVVPNPDNEEEEEEEEGEEGQG